MADALIHPHIRLCLARESRFMGPGPYQLMRLIQETASLRAACERMGISYSKGRRMIDNAEAQLETRLVERKRGGSQKGRSELTAAGIDLVERYAVFLSECQAFVDRAFDAHFSHYRAGERRDPAKGCP